jgi:cellulose synthase/poly-beta-1,6-N-acetylglucosamine synthase-like glycosyltransferase
MAATAGSCQEGFPLMCNGANLAFTRKAYLETLNPDAGHRVASGDDLFLLMKIKKEYGAASIEFLFERKALVRTKAKKTPAEFLSQRLRWVSKSRGYTDPVIMAVAILTWLLNFLLLSGLLAGIFSYPLFLFSMSLFGLKVLLEFPAVYRILGLIGRRNLFWLYPLVQLMNLFYVTGIGTFGNVISVEWKERKISPGGWNTPDKPLHSGGR